MWTLSPWFCEHGSASPDHVIHDRAVHVGAMTVQLHDAKLLPLDVALDSRDLFTLWLVGLPPSAAGCISCNGHFLVDDASCLE
jgi:hypothetical protein